jgi:hypothetical protein
MAINSTVTTFDDGRSFTTKCDTHAVDDSRRAVLSLMAQSCWLCGATMVEVFFPSHGDIDSGSECASGTCRAEQERLSQMEDDSYSG